MAQFKTLQFPNTARGQAAKIRALEQATANGWRIVSETIVPGKFRGGQACCLFLIFAPCAFLAGHTDDIITVTLERDSSLSDGGSSETSEPHPDFDQKKWNALVAYDKEVATAADQVRPLGPKWMAELASGYMTLNDNKYLAGIVESIVVRAKQEQADRAAEIAHEEKLREAEAQEQARLREAQAQERERIMAARKARYARIYDVLWGTTERRMWTSVGIISILLLLAGLGWLLYTNVGLGIGRGSDGSVGTSEPATPLQQVAISQQPLSVTPASTLSPSFNCAKVHSQVLKLVCATSALAALDRQLAIAYSAAMLATPSPEQLRLEERTWIRGRNNSQPDAESLTQMYRYQISYLNGIANPQTPAADQSTAGATAPSVVPRDLSPAVPGSLPSDSPATPSVDYAMEPRFGNTLISRSANVEWHLHFQAEGTFDGTETRSDYHVAGTWTHDQHGLCLTFQPPLRGTPNPDCHPVTAHSLGDTWTSAGNDITLAPGIQ